MTSTTFPGATFAKLYQAADGGCVVVTQADAHAIFGRLSELGGRVGNLEQALAASERRCAQLNDENNKLVSQVVTEEARAVRAEKLLEEALLA